MLAAPRYILTCGHCVSEDLSYLHNSVTIGGVPFGGDVDSGSVDAARIFVNDQGYWGPRFYIYRTSASQLLQINSRAAVGDYEIDDIICKSGISTGHRCGDVTGTNVTAAGNTNQIRFNRGCSGGDSGAPMYSDGDGGIAIAILQACSSTVTVGSHIANVQSSLSLLTSIVAYW